MSFMGQASRLGICLSWKDAIQRKVSCPRDSTSLNSRVKILSMLSTIKQYLSSQTLLGTQSLPRVYTLCLLSNVIGLIIKSIVLIVPCLSVSESLSELLWVLDTYMFYHYINENLPIFFPILIYTLNILVLLK